MGFQANTCVLSGNLTRDPESRALPSGTSVTVFSIAHNERRKNQQTGEYEDRPHYVDVTAFGGLGEWIAKNISKGDPVTVAGSLEQQRWQTGDGQARSKVCIIARDVVPGQRASGGGSTSAPAQQTTGYGSGSGYESSGYGGGDF